MTTCTIAQRRIFSRGLFGLALMAIGAWADALRCDRISSQKDQVSSADANDPGVRILQSIVGGAGGGSSRGAGATSRELSAGFLRRLFSPSHPVTPLITAQPSLAAPACASSRHDVFCS